MHEFAGRIPSVKSLSVASIRNSCQVQEYSNFRPFLDLHDVRSMSLISWLSFLQCWCHSLPLFSLMTMATRSLIFTSHQFGNPRGKRGRLSQQFQQSSRDDPHLDQLGSCQLLTNHYGLGVAHIFQTDLSLGFSPVPRGREVCLT